MRIASFLLIVFCALSCKPLGLAGDLCADGPCAAGLKCVEGVCTVVEPEPPPPPPCETDAQCVVDGSADGRVCNDGVCGFASCFIDLECGVRICDDGFCADRVPCFVDADCDDEQVCASDNVCRNACFSDGDCPTVAGFPVAACVQGECLQRCLNDLMCFGGICEANLCVEPQCAVDLDCEGPGNFFCNGGRCEAFTPCAEDDDCFDPNFFCNEIGRCEELPLCTVDANCGVAGICIDSHCRDVVTCELEDCPDDFECVAGRCVDPAACRVDADCGDQVCDRGRCQAIPAAEAPAAVVVATAHGACRADGGACDVVVFAGDSVDVRLQGFDDEGQPVIADVTASGDLIVTTSDGGRAASIATDVEGVFPIDFGGVVLTVHAVAPANNAALEVIVVDGDTGFPLAGAEVLVADEAPEITDAFGRVAFNAINPGGDDVVAVRIADGRGLALVGIEPAGRMRLPLPPAPTVAAGSAAGFNARVNGTGDELNDVGFALALPMAPRAKDASLFAMFGPPLPGSLELPLLGAVGLTLPAALIVDATVPVVGFQEVKPLAPQVSVEGPSLLLAYEGRFPQNEIVNLAFGVDPVELSLDMAARAEGMDALVASAGVLDALPLVADELDVDADGDINELVPDYAQFPEVEVLPEVQAPLRVGVRSGAPPGQANPRMLVVCGVESAGGFVPFGVATAFGTPETSRGEQLRAVAPPFALGGPHTCAAHATFFDGSASVVVARSGLLDLVDLGALLDPPAGAFILEDIPEDGRSSIVLQAPAASDALRVAVFDGTTTWDVIAPSQGTIRLPAFITPIALDGVSAYRLGDAGGGAGGNEGGSAFAPFTSPAPLRSLDDIASAISFSP